MLKKLVLAFVLSVLIQGTAFAGHKYVITNLLGRDICEFYVSAHNENDWGDDMLAGLKECLHHGNTTTYEGQASTAPTHDLRVVFRDGTDYVIENLNQSYNEGGSSKFELNAN